jgi:phosphoribosylformimino-5-aminoimidazole carboxamide ribotide isomerase
MQLIPAIDLLDGKVVRLTQGRYDDVTVYADDPVREAARFEEEGARRLHVIDLEGARSGTPAHAALVRHIVSGTGLEVQVGGGIRNRVQAEAWLEAGAKRVVVGTAALASPEEIEAFTRAHPGQVIVAVDARDGIVATDGWQMSSGISASDLAEQVDGWGVDGILFTDIARDGTRLGPAIEETAALQARVVAEVIASGGIGSLADLSALEARGIRAAVAGRAIYEGSLSVRDAMRLWAG